MSEVTYQTINISGKLAVTEMHIENELIGSVYYSQMSHCWVGNTPTMDYHANTKKKVIDHILTRERNRRGIKRMMNLMELSNMRLLELFQSLSKTRQIDDPTLLQIQEEIYLRMEDMK